MKTILQILLKPGLGPELNLMQSGFVVRQKLEIHEEELEKQRIIKEAEKTAAEEKARQKAEAKATATFRIESPTPTGMAARRDRDPQMQTQ